DGGLRADRPVGRGAGQRSPGSAFEHPHFLLRRRDLHAAEVVVDEAPSVAPLGGSDRLELGEYPLADRDEGAVRAFVAEEVFGDLPALPCLADAIGDGDTDLVEEFLVEDVAAVDRDDGTNCDTRR